MPTPYYLTKSVFGYDFSRHLKAIGHNIAGYNFPELKQLVEKEGFSVVKHYGFYGFFSRFINELFYIILGEKRVSETRGKMYKLSILSFLAFLAIYGFMLLDFFVPFSKKGFIMVKAVKN